MSALDKTDKILPKQRFEDRFGATQTMISWGRNAPMCVEPRDK